MGFTVSASMFTCQCSDGTSCSASSISSRYLQGGLIGKSLKVGLGFSFVVMMILIGIWLTAGSLCQQWNTFYGPSNEDGDGYRGSFVSMFEYLSFLAVFYSLYVRDHSAVTTANFLLRNQACYSRSHHRWP